MFTNCNGSQGRLAVLFEGLLEAPAPITLKPMQGVESLGFVERRRRHAPHLSALLALETDICLHVFRDF